MRYIIIRGHIRACVLAIDLGVVTRRGFCTLCLINLLHIQVDCNLCGCSNGNVHCTQVQCEAEHAFNDKCRECMSEEINQVCGNNGLTYPSSCAAMNCGGLSSSEYIQGSCPTVVGHLALRWPLVHVLIRSDHFK